MVAANVWVGCGGCYRVGWVWWLLKGGELGVMEAKIWLGVVMAEVWVGCDGR